MDITVWPTDGCNKKCRYCFYEGAPIWNNERTDMNIETANEIIKMVNSGLVHKISFFGGEPLVNWPIIEYIIGETKRIKYSITTNGTLFTPTILDLLRAPDPVFISLSLDGTKKTHDFWRDNSYDRIMKNIDLLLEYPELQILKTMATPDTFYEDVKHIKDLGFPGVFTNLLDPYSHYTYESYDVNDFKHQYRRAVSELHGKDFSLGDYTRWAALIRKVHGGDKNFGCGFSNNGMAVGPSGRLFPCLQAPTSDYFVIGDVWKGLDEAKRKEFCNIKHAPLCVKCVYKFNKCPETMYRKYGHLGVDAPEWHMKFELAKIQVIEDLEGLPHLKAECEPLLETGGERSN